MNSEINPPFDRGAGWSLIASPYDNVSSDTDSGGMDLYLLA